MKKLQVTKGENVEEAIKEQAIERKQTIQKCIEWLFLQVG